MYNYYIIHLYMYTYVIMIKYFISASCASCIYVCIIKMYVQLCIINARYETVNMLIVYNYCYILRHYMYTINYCMQGH